MNIRTYFFLLIISLAINFGCSVSTSSGSSHTQSVSATDTPDFDHPPKPNDTNGNTESVLLENKMPESITKLSYLGCWSSSKGAVVKLSAKTLYAVEPQHLRYSYKEIERKQSDDKDEFLLEVSNPEQKSNTASYINKFVLLQFYKARPSEMALLSYSSYENYTNDRVFGAGSFTKDSCSSLGL
jgi:hypothetical protein